jgi:mannose-1-phosphate guanylyltransferase
MLFDAGIERVLINTHYLAGAVRDHVGASRWADRIDLVHEDRLYGTGGTILKNADCFADQTFLVAHADNLTWFDVQAFVNRHDHRPHPERVPITMLTFETDSPETCGIVERDTEGLVVAFHEKVPDPPGRIANGAIYLFEPDILHFLRGLGREVIDLSHDILPRFMGRMATFHNDQYLRDIGNLESLARAEQDVASTPALRTLRERIDS